MEPNADRFARLYFCFGLAVHDEWAYATVKEVSANQHTSERASWAAAGEQVLHKGWKQETVEIAQDLPG